MRAPFLYAFILQAEGGLEQGVPVFQFQPGISEHGIAALAVDAGGKGQGDRSLCFRYDASISAILRTATLKITLFWGENTTKNVLIALR